MIQPARPSAPNRSAADVALADCGAFCRVARDHDHDRDDKQECQQDARQHACQEQAPDAFLGEDRVDHEPGRRGDEDSQGTARRDRAGREAVVIVVALHLRQGDAAHGQRRGERRPRQRRETRTADDGRRGKAATQVAEPSVRGVIEIAAHPRHTREVPHENEQRDDQQRKVRRLAENLARQSRDRGLGADHVDPDRPHQHHGEPDRHPDEKQDEKRGEAEERDSLAGHQSTASLGSSPFQWMKPTSSCTRMCRA